MKKLLTEKEYAKIKELLALGLSNKIVSSVAKRGTATISRIKNSDDFESYLEIGRRHRAKHDSKKLSDGLDKMFKDQASWSEDPILTELKAQTEELRKLRGQLVGIEAQINTLKTKKKWL